MSKGKPPFCLLRSQESIVEAHQQLKKAASAHQQTVPPTIPKKADLVQPLDEGVEAGSGEVVLVANDGKTRYAVNAAAFKYYSNFAKHMLDQQGESPEPIPLVDKDATPHNIQLMCTWLKHHETVRYSKQSSPMPTFWNFEQYYTNKWDVAFMRQELQDIDEDSASDGKLYVAKPLELLRLSNYFQIEPFMDMLCTYLCFPVKRLGRKPSAVKEVRGWFGKSSEVMTTPEEEEEEVLRAATTAWIHELAPPAPVSCSMLDEDEFSTPPCTTPVNDGTTSNISTTPSTHTTSDDASDAAAPHHASTVNDTMTTTTAGGGEEEFALDDFDLTSMSLPPARGPYTTVRISTRAGGEIQFPPANFEFLVRLKEQEVDEQGKSTLPVALANKLIQKLSEPVSVCDQSNVAKARQAARLGHLGDFLTHDLITQIDRIKNLDEAPKQLVEQLSAFIFTCVLTQPDASALLLDFIRSKEDGSIWKRIASSLLTPKYDNLYEAVRVDDGVESIYLLVATGADVDQQKGDYMGMTPIQWGLLGFNLDAVAALLECGADVNTQDQLGFTAAYRAVQRDNGDAIRALYQYGADLNKRDKRFGKTPAQHAASTNKLNALRALHECGADLNMRGKTPEFSPRQ